MTDATFPGQVRWSGNVVLLVLTYPKPGQNFASFLPCIDVMTSDGKVHVELLDEVIRGGSAELSSSCGNT